METSQHILNKPFVKIGFLLGLSYVIAQYLFYYGGRNVVLDETFGSAIQLLTILGLYLGLSHCHRVFPEEKFWKLFLWGIGIILIAVGIRTLFSMLLYGFLAPEMGQNYSNTLTEQMNKAMQGMQTLPKEQYQEMTKKMLTPFTIPVFEGISLSFLGVIFSIFIAALQNMFRK